MTVPALARSDRNDIARYIGVVGLLAVGGEKQRVDTPGGKTGQHHQPEDDEPAPPRAAARHRLGVRCIDRFIRRGFGVVVGGDASGGGVGHRTGSASVGGVKLPPRAVRS